MADPRACLACAAIGLFVGCQGSIGTGESPDAGTAGGLDINGRWAMFVFEDPVAVDITAARGVINGRGCCSGLGERSAALQCCGAVTGQIVERTVSFGFSFDVGGESYSYWTDAVLSADARRMTGTFSRGGVPVTWLRVHSYDAWLPIPEPSITEIPLEREGSFGLMLVDDPPAGSDFQAQRTYQFNTHRQFVNGDLGAFWTGEWAGWAGNQTLGIGPVPETTPSLPVILELQFDGPALVSVLAIMPSGTRYTFQATSSQP
jgi:hypothetical protein